MLVIFKLAKILTMPLLYNFSLKQKSAYEPSGLSGRILSRFP